MLSLRGAICTSFARCGCTQNGLYKPLWVWVPYACYYHLYSKADLFRCAVLKNISWIHAMGDSQEREFVSMFKFINGSRTTLTKYSSGSTCQWDTVGYQICCGIVEHVLHPCCRRGLR